MTAARCAACPGSGPAPEQRSGGSGLQGHDQGGRGAGGSEQGGRRLGASEGGPSGFRLPPWSSLCCAPPPTLARLLLPTPCNQPTCAPHILVDAGAPLPPLGALCRLLRINVPPLPPVAIPVDTASQPLLGSTKISARLQGPQAAGGISRQQLPGSAAAAATPRPAAPRGSPQGRAPPAAASTLLGGPRAHNPRTAPADGRRRGWTGGLRPGGGQQGSGKHQMQGGEVTDVLGRQRHR